jgi:hypothetical protein
MIPCETIFDKHIDKEMSGEYYCPESGTINYAGSAGTNLWVVPKTNSTLNIVEDKSPFYHNFVEVHWVSDYFDIGDYMDNEARANGDYY